MARSVSIVFGPLPPPFGGVSVFMSTLYAHIVNGGGEVWAYTGIESASDYPQARFIAHDRLAHIGALLRAGKGRRVIDSSHFHLEYPNWLLLPLWLAAKKIIGFDWVKIIHDGSLPARYPEFTPSQQRLFARALHAVDEVFVVSDELAEFVR